jgi:hypothetical protein
MANNLAFSALVAREALAILENNLAFASMVNRNWEDEYASNQARGYSPGATINIKRPPRYQYRAGRVAVPQATVETTVPLTLSQGGCDISFTSFERTLQVQQLSQKIAAAMATVTNEIDRQGLQLARFATNQVIGVPGTAPQTALLATQAFTGLNQRLDEQAAPRDNRRGFVMNPSLNASMIVGLSGLFNAQPKLSTQYGNGLVVDSFGMTVDMGQNVDRHVNGTQAVAGTNIAGAGQTGANITVVGLGGTITRGTRITLPGVNFVNPQSRVDTGTAAQFIVTADVAAGATVIPISPAIVTTGPFQNVTASPTDGAAFTIFGVASQGYTTSVAFHQDAFTMAMVPMATPPASTGVSSATASHKGMNLRVTDYYDGVNDNTNTRIDVLFGWAATYPELACIYAQ